MSVEVHTLAAITSTALSLDVRRARISLDETRRPYAEAILTCAYDEATVDLVDPRDDVRVTLELVRNGAIKTLNLLLHGRRIDYVEATMELTLRSDEAYLIDAGLVATAPDLSAVGDRGSLRAIVEAMLDRYGMVLEPGSADFDFSGEVATTATNLIPNPSAEVNTSGVASVTGAATLSRSTAQHQVGVACFASTVTSGTTAGITFINGANAYIPVVAGTAYTFSAYVRNSVARDLQLAIQWRSAPGTNLGAAVFSAATNVGTAWTRLSLTATAPVGATYVIPYFLGAGYAVGNVMYVDAVMLTEGSALHDYFDGSTPDDQRFYCEWTGTPHDSASIRLDAGPLRWRPGVAAWDFLAPLVETSGLRLFCDEYRDWYLEEADTIREGLVIVSETINLTEAAETVSRSEEWYDSVVIIYEWSEGGEQHTAYDVAGPGTKVLTETRETAYPGPGAAEAIRRRAAGRGQVLRLLATSDYTARPWMEIIATPPHGPAQVGVVSAIEWRMPEDLMTVRSRGLVETPPTAWIFDAPGISWASVPAGIDWTEDI